MMENDTPTHINSTQIENVDTFIYLGLRYSARGKTQDKEFQRTITAGWTVFANHRYERIAPRGRPARRWRDETDDYWKGTIWQNIAQDGQMWNQRAETFSHLRETMAALMMVILMMMMMIMMMMY